MSVSAGPNNVVESNLILHLDSATKNSYPRTGAIWYDLSGKNNHGTFFNGPTFNSDNGGSINFSGTSYILTANKLNAFSLNGMTLIAWIRPNATNIIQGFIGSNVNGKGPEFRLNGAGLNYLDQGARNIIFATGSVPASSWTFACISHDFIGGSYSLYLNRNIIFNGSSIIGPNWGDSKLEISAYTIGDHFQGRISKVLVYNRALSYGEVIQNFNSTRGRFGVQ